MGVVLYMCRYWFFKDGEYKSVPQDSEAELAVLECLANLNMKLPPDGAWLDALIIRVDDSIDVRWICSTQAEFYPIWYSRCFHAFPEYKREVERLIERLEQLN